MECAKAAQAIARSPACDPAQGGEPMIFLNIGEPDFTAPPPVLRAAEACLTPGPHAVHRGHRPAGAARAHRRLVRQPLRPGHRPGAHRRHRRRVGGAAAGLPGAVRAGRRGADARPQLPLQPPLRRRRRRPRAAAAGRARQRASSSTRRRSCAHWQADTRGVLLASPSNPTGTSIARGRDGGHRAGGARRAAASRWSTRSTSA